MDVLDAVLPSVRDIHLRSNISFEQVKLNHIFYGILNFFIFFR